MNDNNKSVRVLFVVDSTFPGSGGAEAQARKLGRALTAKGVELEFVAPRTLAHLSVEEQVDGVRLHRIKYPLFRVIGAMVLLVRFALYLYKRRNDFDVIHVHITRLLASVAVAMRPVTGVPVIAKISGYFEFKGGVLDSDALNPGNLILRRILRKIDYVQTISAETRVKLLDAGFKNEQILFIPNGIDTGESNTESNTENSIETSARNTAKDEHKSNESSGDGVVPLVFGYCGRLRQIKGVHILIDAFEVFAKTQPEGSVKLRIAGDGNRFEELTQGVTERNLTDCIEFLGNVEDTGSFYKSLDIYVQPSFAEGLPNAVIEAMVCRLPVLATNIGGNSDLVNDEEQGWLFEAGDTKALTQLMQRCVDERESLRTMGSAGRKRIVDNYDIDAVTEELLSVYRG